MHNPSRYVYGRAKPPPAASSVSKSKKPGIDASSVAERDKTHAADVVAAKGESSSAAERKKTHATDVVAAKGESSSPRVQASGPRKRRSAASLVKFEDVAAGEDASMGSRLTARPAKRRASKPKSSK
jgi:hypothetical protein